ncbi:unnamed protein product [Cyprideis torosa]|uniref:Uncharacterized protein n=1 Tax=Cyprideis torosa TaxID=163714 RepID=A0A7R8ZQL0_9CRUS|nr:unnamed protein product [Cyprideis torosa]CAG0903162.1 unnamed protein product [Cyprideis torosa]
MASSDITLRVQSPIGMKRITVKRSTTADDLVARVAETFNLKWDVDFGLFLDRKQEHPLEVGPRVTVQKLRLNHGDILYLFPRNGVKLIDNDPPKPMSASSSSSSLAKMETSRQSPVPVEHRVGLNSQNVSKKTAKANVVEDEVDQILKTKEAKVERKRDPK